MTGCRPEDMRSKAPALGEQPSSHSVHVDEAYAQDIIEAAVTNGLAETVNRMVDPTCDSSQKEYTPSSTPIEPDQNYPFGSPLEGALRIYSSKYQTCKILGNVGGSETFEGKTPDILREWKRKKEYPSSSEASACIDATNLNRKLSLRNIFKSSEKVLTSPMEYSQGWRGPGMKGNTLMVHQSATDCSSFVSGAMMAVGLKMSKNATPNNFLTTTASIESDLESDKSCLEKVKFSGLEDILRPGDVLNDSRGGHVVMIDRLGQDPLGINKVLSSLMTEGIALDSVREAAAEECKKISLNDMDLTIIHSTTSRTGSGIVRENAKAIQSGTATRILIGHARSACLSLVKTFPQQVSFTSSKGVCDTCSVLRHKGTKDPQCVLKEKPKVQGEECINDCLQSYIKS